MINITEQKAKRFNIAVIICSFLLLITSLSQNAFYVGSINSPEKIVSLYAFFCGWTVFLGTGISWLANPFLIFSWLLLFKKPRLAQYCSIMAVLLSMSFLLLNNIVTNEGGISKEILSYDTGYWLWLFSCIVNCLGIFIQQKIYK